jgi:hypothetical protein
MASVHVRVGPDPLSHPPSYQNILGTGRWLPPDNKPDHLKPTEMHWVRCLTLRRMLQAKPADRRPSSHSRAVDDYARKWRHGFQEP